MDRLSNEEPLIRLVVEYQDRIYRYIYSLCPVEDDVREILQETCLALLRNADAYDIDRPFLPWAYRFAQLEIVKHRGRISRNRRVLDSDVVELLARQRQANDGKLQARLEQLDSCIEQLNDADQKLLHERYFADSMMDNVAERLGMSRRSLFRSLQRIRQLLLDCITKRVAEGTL